MGRPRTINREAVLEAAAALAGELGAAALTLEAVAARAGISKGGLQYLFKSKQQLLQAMIEHHMVRMRESVDNVFAELPETPGRGLKAYIVGNLHEGMQRDATAAALMSAVLSDPELLAPARKEYRKNLDDLKKQGVPRELAMVVLCAVDGLMLSEFLQMDPFTPGERKRLVAALMQLAETGQVEREKAAAVAASRKAR